MICIQLTLVTPFAPIKPIAFCCNRLVQFNPCYGYAITELPLVGLDLDIFVAAVGARIIARKQTADSDI